MVSASYIEFTEPLKACLAEGSVSGEDLGPKEALIRSEVSLISAGTELAHFRGIEPGVKFPDRPGYAMIGRIEAKGDELGEFAVGERVFFAGRHASRQRFTHGQGHEWGHLFRVPEGLTSEQASLTALARISYTAVEVTQVRLGDQVAVFGLGLIGLLAGLLAQIQGARVLGVDPSPERAARAQAAGLRFTDSGPVAGQVERIREWSGGGVEVAFEATGLSAVALPAVNATADLGRVALLGSPREAFPADLTPLLWDLHLRGVSLMGAHMFRYPCSAGRTTGLTVEAIHARMLGLLGKGEIAADRLISHVISPAEAVGIYERLLATPEAYGGVLIDWRA